MTKSNLTDITILNNHYDSRNNRKIEKITIHHMAGNLSAETCGYVFQNVEASANYGVDSQGRIGCYVEEEYRAWSTTNYDNDSRAINIEVANDVYGGNWHVSDKAIERLIDLCVDICKRYDFKLIYDGTPNGSLTRHNMFMATVCPGEYLQSKFEYIAEEVNKRLEDKSEPIPTISDDELLDLVRKTIRGDFGVGDERVKALGENYQKVQDQVNANYEHGTANYWDDIRLY